MAPRRNLFRIRPISGLLRCRLSRLLQLVEFLKRADKRSYPTTKARMPGRGQSELPSQRASGVHWIETERAWALIDFPDGWLSSCSSS